MYLTSCAEKPWILCTNLLYYQFNYADIVWDNSSGTLSNMLENLRLEAIRIILGAFRGTSHEKLYKESGFCTLKERRKRHKLLMFHKMIYYQCPKYLSNLVLPLVWTTSPHYRRRPHERVIPAHKTELYANSFIPSITQLPLTIETNPSISLLKKYLSTNDTMIPVYYYFGTRKEQVKHCRLRLAISDLNYDLFRRHLVCSCGYTAETSEHFLLHCRLYNMIGNKTINKLYENERNINTLLFGNDQLHLETNQKNICYSPRFFAPNRPLVDLWKSAKICLGYTRRSTRFNHLPHSVSLRSIIMTSLDHSFT